MPKRSRRDSSTLASCERPPEGRRELEGKSLVAGGHQAPPARTNTPARGPASAKDNTANETQTRPNHDFRFHGIAIIYTFMPMTSRHATLIVAGLAGILAMRVRLRDREFNGSLLHLVHSRVYPAKPADAAIPILAKFPSGPYTAIGRLAFASDRGWPFLRKSMVYNARVHGADAVVLRSAHHATREFLFEQIPPQVDWVPTGSRRGQQWQGLLASGAICPSGLYPAIGRGHYSD